MRVLFMNIEEGIWTARPIPAGAGRIPDQI